MLNLIKKYKFLLIIFSLLLITTICFTTIKTNYDAYLPGEISRVSNVVEISKDDSSENYYSTSVYYVEKITLFQKLVFSNIKDASIYKRSEVITSEIDRLQGEIEHNSAIFTSIISAYDAANVSLDYTYKGIYVYYTNSKVLNVGDVVLGANKEEVENNLKSDEVKILRDNEETTVKLNSGDKVVLDYPYYVINNSDIKIYYSNNGGPSAGLMQALKLYDDLVDDNYLANMKIAGTGTIDEYGNVGAIGCIDLKIYTAMYNNCDIFFIPEENKAEAQEALKKIDTKMTIIYVSTLDEAIDALRSFNND